MKKILVLCALCMFTASIVGCTGSTTSAPPTDTKVKDTKAKDTPKDTPKDTKLAP